MNISFEDFLKVDVRVGKVLEAENVPKSKKLLKLKVDFGSEGVRTVVAGIAASYNPEDLINYNVIGVVNLEPRTMAGIESNAMLLASSDSKGLPELLTVCNIQPGQKVG